MQLKNAKREFELAIAAAGKQLHRLRPGEGIQLMLDFYRTARAEECNLEQDGDMLLFQYGTYDREGAKRFDFGVTRQFIVGDGEDDDFWQLSLTFEFPAASALELIGNGDRWCPSPGHLDQFETFIATHAATLAVRDREDGRAHLLYECVG